MGTSAAHLVHARPCVMLHARQCPIHAYDRLTSWSSKVIDGGVSPCSAVSPGCGKNERGSLGAHQRQSRGVGLGGSPWQSRAIKGQSRGNQGAIKGNQGAIKGQSSAINGQSRAINGQSMGNQWAINGQSRELKRQSRDSRLSVALDHCGTHYQWHTTKGTQ